MKRKKNQPVATRNQFEIQMLVMSKNNSLGSLVVKHMLRGEGREGKRAVSTNVCNFYTDLFQV